MRVRQERDVGILVSDRRSLVLKYSSGKSAVDRPPWGRPDRSQRNTASYNSRMPTREMMTTFLDGLVRYQLSIGARGLESLLLAQGFWFEGRAESKDHEPADQWRKRNRPKAKECFFNAQQFCIDEKKARYFKGYALSDSTGIPVEHGWAVLAGQVIDFTFEAMERSARRQKILIETRTTLYLGVEVPTHFVRQRMAEEGASEAVAEKFYRLE